EEREDIRGSLRAAEGDEQDGVVRETHRAEPSTGKRRGPRLRGGASQTTTRIPAVNLAGAAA
ncbi:MAG: hypothetical protein PHO07_16210, partial [Pirellulales bacterium]|nr:hypothetical protein [Pirellulales bacterium]